MDASVLRQLADEVEKEDSEVTMTVYEHGLDVVDPEKGNMVVDRAWSGRSIIIQTQGTNLQALFMRLWKELIPKEH